MEEKFYITTTLPYVNAKPHIGHVLEFIQADVIARYHRTLGEDVFFNVGTDEHGQKVYQKALEEGMDLQDFVDKYARKFEELKGDFNLSWTNFIKTTDPHHIAACQEFWKRCLASGDIYKKNYEIRYCVGCELEKTDSELQNGLCPIHPNLKLETREEENYFFRWSKYQKPLLKFYEENPDFVLPDFRFNEIKSFVKQGLNDFSISRLKEKMPWGILVPSDDRQVMYVWFDALINYISTLGWPEDEAKFRDFWPGVQIAGKDNLRQQTAMWQAMLMSAGLPNSKQVLIHGFVTSGGQKMSKSLENVIDPIEMVKKYGIDPVRYYLLREIPSDEDGDFSAEKLEARYNGDLANNLGNLVSRVAKLIETKLEGELVFETRFLDGEIEKAVAEAKDACGKKIDDFKLHEALSSIFELLARANRYIDDNKPWADAGDHPEHFLKTMTTLVFLIINSAKLLWPFLPETAEKIAQTFGQNLVSSQDTILEGRKFVVAKTEPLFPRLEK
jgi:methionyl-tRNA synthetase